MDTIVESVPPISFEHWLLPYKATVFVVIETRKKNNNKTHVVKLPILLLFQTVIFVSKFSVLDKDVFDLKMFQIALWQTINSS